MPAYPDSGNTHTRFTVRLDQLIILDAMHAAYLGDGGAAIIALLADADGLARKRMAHRVYRFGQRCKRCGMCFSAAVDVAFQQAERPQLAGRSAAPPSSPVEAQP